MRGHDLEFFDFGALRPVAALSELGHQRVYVVAGSSSFHPIGLCVAPKELPCGPRLGGEDQARRRLYGRRSAGREGEELDY